MMVNTVVATTTAAAVLTPTLTDAIQAAQSVVTKVNALLTEVNLAVTQAQFAMDQAQAAADQASGLITSVPVATLTNMTALISSLPTTEPTTSGVLWLNGNALQIS